MTLLHALAEQAGLKAAIEAMYTGERINVSENRAVLHTALRNVQDQAVHFSSQNVMPGIHRVLDQMEQFCDQVYAASRVLHCI